MRKEFLLIFCFVFLLLPLIPQRIVDLEAMRGQPITVTIEGAAVSYTHLDVYKRQTISAPLPSR